MVQKDHHRAAVRGMANVACNSLKRRHRSRLDGCAGAQPAGVKRYRAQFGETKPRGRGGGWCRSVRSRHGSRDRVQLGETKPPRQDGEDVARHGDSRLNRYRVEFGETKPVRTADSVVGTHAAKVNGYSCNPAKRSHRGRADGVGRDRAGRGSADITAVRRNEATATGRAIWASTQPAGLSRYRVQFGETKPKPRLRTRAGRARLSLVSYDLPRGA